MPHSLLCRRPLQPVFAVLALAMAIPGAGLAPGAALATPAPAASIPAQGVPTPASARDLALFAGRWQIDPTRTHMGRDGPQGTNILRSATFTFVFTPQRSRAMGAGEMPGLMMDVYASYPQPAPSHSMPLVADGQWRACPGPASCMTRGGTASEQTYVWYSLDPHLMVRLFSIKGVPYDYSTLNVSTDGQTMTLISWDPKTPQYQNIQVFTKQP